MQNQTDYYKLQAFWYLQWYSSLRRDDCLAWWV